MRRVKRDLGLFLVCMALLLVVVLMVVSQIHASSIGNGGGGGGGGGTGNAAANVTTAFSATPTFTCPSATAGTVVNFALSTALTANITSSTLASCTPGSMLNFLFTQDGTGGRTVAMPTGFDPASVNPVAGITTKCSYFLDGAGNGRLTGGGGVTGGGCASTANFAFGPEVAAPPNSPAGTCFAWFDSTNATARWNCNGLSFSPVFPQSRPPNQFVTGILATGQITTAPIAPADLPAGSGATAIAFGQTAMPTAALAGNSCSAAATTATATGALTTDAAEVTFASDPTGIVGYGGGTNGGITISPWITANTMNFKLCNQTAASITPGALNINWRIVR